MEIEFEYASKNFLKDHNPDKCDYEYEHYPEADLITLVRDNFGTHTPGAFYERFEPAEAKRLLDRFEFVFTPKHASWLDMAEIELNVLNNQCLGRRIDSIDKVREEVEA